MRLHHSRINTEVGWGRGWGMEQSACLGLHTCVGARRNTAWKCLPGLPVLAKGLESGMRGRDPPEGGLSRPKDKASGEGLHSASVSQQQRIFFHQGRNFPCPQLYPMTFPLFQTHPPHSCTLSPSNKQTNKQNETNEKTAW